MLLCCCCARGCLCPLALVITYDTLLLKVRVYCPSGLSLHTLACVYLPCLPIDPKGVCRCRYVVEISGAQLCVGAYVCLAVPVFKLAGVSARTTHRHARLITRSSVPYWAAVLRGAGVVACYRPRLLLSEQSPLALEFGARIDLPLYLPQRLSTFALFPGNHV